MLLKLNEFLLFDELLRNLLTYDRSQTIKEQQMLLVTVATAILATVSSNTDEAAQKKLPVVILEESVQAESEEPCQGKECDPLVLNTDVVVIDPSVNEQE